MKKSSKSSSKSKRSKRSRTPSSERKIKIFKSRSKSKEVEKKNEEKVPRKTRWQTQEPPPVVETDKAVTVAVEEPPLRIRDLIENKEKLLEYLFLTVTETALEELIPDYLKKNSLDELKRLCAEQIKDMSKECILNVISGKDASPEKKEKKPKPPIEKSSLTVIPSPSLSDNLSGDVLELCASASEIKSVIPDEENQAPVPEEAVEEFRVPESDADLLELEMRARAIRSLLKAKNQETGDSDAKEPSVL